MNPFHIISIRPNFHWLPVHNRIGMGHSFVWLKWWVTFDWSWWKYRNMTVRELENAITDTARAKSITYCVNKKIFAYRFWLSGSWRELASEYAMLLKLPHGAVLGEFRLGGR